ncbi:hypothetical protein B296_00030057, partial [Ensete ventricosum]
FLEQVSRTTSLEGESKEDRPGHTNYKFPISLTLVHLCRFEMPFNVWCGGCNSMIAKGVRFNAEKKQVGNYYSTKVLENFFYCIWSFTMKSACCKHEIVIQTDPKNCEYVITSGAQRKTEDFDIEDAETFAFPADDVMCLSFILFSYFTC